MKNTDVLIIGGSAAGMVTALAGKAHWPDKEFILVKKQKDVMVPCGIPYIFGTLESTEKNLMPVDAMMQKNGIVSLVDEAIQNRMSVNSFLIMQIGTHPCLTASPAAYPLIKASEMIAIHLNNNKGDK